jgi:hypothetical protein
VMLGHLTPGGEGSSQVQDEFSAWESIGHMSRIMTLVSFLQLRVKNERHSLTFAMPTAASTEVMKMAMLEVQRIVFTLKQRQDKASKSGTPHYIVDRKNREEEGNEKDRLEWMENSLVEDAEAILRALTKVYHPTQEPLITLPLLFGITQDSRQRPPLEGAIPGRLGGRENGLLVPWGGEEDTEGNREPAAMSTGTIPQRTDGGSSMSQHKEHHVQKTHKHAARPTTLPRATSKRRREQEESPGTRKSLRTRTPPKFKDV